MLLHYFTHAAEVTVASTRDAIGLLYSAVDQLLEGDVFSLRKAVRMLLKLVLALFLLVAPSIADIQYLTSSNVTRSYWIHPPDDFQQGHKYPVVIAFHGGSRLGSDADGFAMELDARLSLPLVRTSYSKNRYFVYPNGVGGAWAGPTYAEVSVEEDLQFVSDMIADIKSRYSNIDDNRIYAAGMSNGGGFVGTLACSEVGAQFAGFASVASSFYTDLESVDCSPARLPLPMLEIHGGSDKVVPYAGGMGHGGPLPPIPEWLGFWAERNSCTSNITTHRDGGNVHHTSWTCGGQNGTLHHWKVDANGHDWPSKSRNLNMIVAGMGPQPIEANELVIEFFDRFSLDRSV